MIATSLANRFIGVAQIIKVGILLWVDLTLTETTLNYAVVSEVYPSITEVDALTFRVTSAAAFKGVSYEVNCIWSTMVKGFEEKGVNFRQVSVDDVLCG